VEQREPTEDHLICGEIEQIGAHHLGVAGEVGVGELGALRLTGGARGVEDHGGVLVIPIGDLMIRGHRGD
jgi:hypothetical protein